MIPATVAALVDLVRQTKLLTAEQLDELTRGLAARFKTPQALARDLVLRGWLTTSQVNEIFVGRGKNLLLGSYVLVEKLGEGGMGAVYKARNWKMGQLVALKLIRKDRLANSNSVKRFYREIRAASQLNHPNIVRAIDADETNGTHFFVMEYVEGADLYKLVKSQGALEVRQACDYIRQIALGLQHAFERGMVHRDIKPHNLLLSYLALARAPLPVTTKDAPSGDSGTQYPDFGLVKILDMGLARLDSDADDDQSGTMTHDGAVIGTPDYIAPEQGLNSHTVDIRADLYSLGCTLYYCLAGHAPFAGGSMMEKLLKHQQEMPTPLSLIRSDVPSAVEAIVVKLLAKRPEHRYQSPVELAQALAAFLNGTPHVGPPVRSVMPLNRPANDESAALAESALMFSDSATPVLSDDHRVPKRPVTKPKWLWPAGAASLAVSLLLLMLWIFSGRKPAPKVEPEVPVAKKDAPKKVGSSPALAFETWVDSIRVLPPGEQIQAVAARLKQHNLGFDGRVEHDIVNGEVAELKFSSDKVTDIEPIRALPSLKRLECPGSQPGRGSLSDLTALAGMKLTRLVVSNNRLGSLTPLRGMPLTHLDCENTAIADLGPLQNMPLKYLDCTNTNVTNLATLKKLPMQTLILNGAPVKSLAPLEDMQLKALLCKETQIFDLTPLKGMPLIHFDCRKTPIADLRPLQDVPLQSLGCDFSHWRDSAILKAIKTLKTINDVPTGKFWLAVDRQRADFDAWREATAKLKGAEQSKAVIAKLREFNPSFTGKVDVRVKSDGSIDSISFVTDQVTNIAPVAALESLRSLDCAGVTSTAGKLRDLFPLAGLKLTRLNCQRNPVTDLAPLQGMPITELNCHETNVADLNPLKSMPLEKLQISSTRVRSLGPLQGMKLTHLECQVAAIADLAPLEGMPLTYLTCNSTQVATIGPLRKMPLATLFIQSTKVTDYDGLRDLPLKNLSLDLVVWRDSALIRSIPTLEKVNGKPVAEITAWADWEDSVRVLAPKEQLEAVEAKLFLLNPRLSAPKIEARRIETNAVLDLILLGEEYTDISPVRVFRELQSLHLGTTDVAGGRPSKLTNLGPLKGLKLKHLSLTGALAFNLTPLKGMDLESLVLTGSPVSDLNPLRNMPLKELWCDRNTELTSLEPLRDVPTLEKLVCRDNPKLNNLKALEGLPLQYLDCEKTNVTNLTPLKFLPNLRELAVNLNLTRDWAVLNSLPRIETINGKAKADVLK